MKVKMCGLYRPEDIDYANEVQPDYVGFVFYEKSHRAVTKEQAAEYRKKLLPGIRTVGVRKAFWMWHSFTGMRRKRISSICRRCATSR